MTTAGTLATAKRPHLRLLRRGASLLLLVAVSIAFMYPFVWLLSASFKPRGDVFDNRLIRRISCSKTTSTFGRTRR